MKSNGLPRSNGELEVDYPSTATASPAASQPVAPSGFLELLDDYLTALAIAAVPVRRRSGE